MRARRPSVPWLVVTLVLVGASVLAEPRAQSRLHGTRITVRSATIRIMDGDTAEIHWSRADVETVRVLGIDTPELFGRRHGAADWNGSLPLSARGAEARGFARGAFASAPRIELLRSTRLDRYRRTLGYFFLGGRNYSVMVLEAGLARETISEFGDNGFPAEARAVLDAAQQGASGTAR
jgi:micrococcal nuclease